MGAEMFKTVMISYWESRLAVGKWLKPIKRLKMKYNECCFNHD